MSRDCPIKNRKLLESLNIVKLNTEKSSPGIANNIIIVIIKNIVVDYFEVFCCHTFIRELEEAFIQMQKMYDKDHHYLHYIVIVYSLISSSQRSFILTGYSFIHLTTQKFHFTRTL